MSFSNYFDRDYPVRLTMEYDTSEIIDSNGTKFRVGWDEFGWFSIERGEMHEGEFYPDDSPITSFPPHKIGELIEIIEQRLNQ